MRSPSRLSPKRAKGLIWVLIWVWLKMGIINGNMIMWMKKLMKSTPYFVHPKNLYTKPLLFLYLPSSSVLTDQTQAPNKTELKALFKQNPRHTPSPSSKQQQRNSHPPSCFSPCLSHSLSSASVSLSNTHGKTSATHLSFTLPFSLHQSNKQGKSSLPLPRE